MIYYDRIISVKIEGGKCEQKRSAHYETFQRLNDRIISVKIEGGKCEQKRSAHYETFQRWNRQWERPRNSLGDSFGWCWIYQSRTIHIVAHFWVQLHPEGHSSLGVQKLGNILCCYVHNLCSLCNPRTILLTRPVFLEIDCFKFLELRSHVVDNVKCQQRFISSMLCISKILMTSLSSLHQETKIGIFALK